MRKIIYLLFFIFQLQHHNLAAQQNNIAFKHLNIDNGLSQNSVNVVHQDNRGFMWFGTHDGLNRYDGYQFIHYRNERNNKNSISNNYIYDIHEDDDGVLWIATFGGGLNSLNPVTGEVKRVKMIYDDSVSFPGSSLFSISEYPKGILWIGSGEGLIRFDKKSGLARIFLDKKNADNIYEYNYIGTIAADDNGNLWLQSNSGLTKFNTQSLEAEYFRRAPFSNSFEMGDILDIEYINDVLLIACEVGLVEINLKQKTDKLLLDAALFRTGEQTPLFQRLIPISHHRCAIGTTLGLIIFDTNTNDYSYYQNDAADENSLSHNTVLSLFKSYDGILWIGTRNGLNKIETEKPNFIHIRCIPGKEGLSSKNVSSFVQEKDSLLWIGTTDGLNIYNKNNNTFKIFRKGEENSNSLLSNYILCLFKDSNENIWVGTRGGGFYKIETTPGGDIKFNHIQAFNDTSSVLTVHAIAEGEDGNLWVGTGGEGLWKYNPANNLVKKYGTAKDGTGLSHPYVFKILEDSHKNIWLGTPSGGINLFDPQTERFIYFQNDPDNEYSINNDIILSFYEDGENNLWIGTNDGLVKLIPKLNDDIFQKLMEETTRGNDSLFRNFGHADGFPNAVIYGMLEDKHRKLWISTNNGLVVFDMDTEQVVKTYDVSDGLQSNEFNQNAYFKSSDGFFLFGGVNGVNMFHPDSLAPNKYIPPVVFTDISIFNESLNIRQHSEDENLYLEKAVFALDEINLSWEHKVISIEFAALSYISPEKNEYRYKLEGFNKDWVEAGTKRSTTYTHLDPGNYFFKVQASNNNGIWNDKGTSLKISISAPPWLSWYAYLAYFFLFLSILLLFVRYRINKGTREIKIKAQIEKAREQEREVFRKKSAADFHDEAGNKITKITLLTEMARNELNNKAKLESYLKKIQLNISGLSTGMRDFLWVLDPHNDSLFETILRLKDFGDSILTETGVDFTIKGMQADFDAIVLPINTRRDILQIFKEAINNCAKYAVASEVILNTSVSDHFVEISICDNGKGFEPSAEKVKNKYGLTIMRERAKNIDADLKIHSIKNKGTHISLKFNMPQMGNR